MKACRSMTKNLLLSRQLPHFSETPDTLLFLYISYHSSFPQKLITSLLDSVRLVSKERAALRKTYVLWSDQERHSFWRMPRLHKRRKKGESKKWRHWNPRNHKMNSYLLSSLLLRHLCVFKFLCYELWATWVTNTSKFFFTSTPYTVDAQYILVNLNEGSEQGNSQAYISAPRTEARPRMQTQWSSPLVSGSGCPLG